VSESWLDTALRALREAQHRERPAPPTFVSWSTYRTLWGWEESQGRRPAAWTFHALARRRFRRELWSALKYRI
jgi:hypothetical protein